ncbi:uncharacterized protein V6R79_020233 [Siganus canaliculatus]
MQGGENRRILLDLKTVLEEVQLELKREEEKRGELQLLYTRDRCAWELEKAELKSRIAQLEARECAGLISAGVQAVKGPASASSPEKRGETTTLRREREEQRRLLADTHSAAMDLRCRLEHNERDWSREKAELLERFDVERREWESQLRDMQKKIEELYCEVRAKREGTGLDCRMQDTNDVVHRLSIRSTSTGSSLLSDNSRSDPLSSSSHSEPIRHSPLPGFCRDRTVTERHQSTSLQEDSVCEYNNPSGQFTQDDLSLLELVDELKSRGSWQQDAVTNSNNTVDTTELDAIFHGDAECVAPQTNVSKENERNVRVSRQESPLWSELSYSSDRKKNSIALNAALKEIARVSEELCSYQDEIRKKSGDRRNQFESLCLQEESSMLYELDKTQFAVDETPCDLSQIYDDLRALGRENWITLSPDNTWQTGKGPSRTNTTERDRQSPGLLCEIDTPAPPIPPRTSSRSLSTPTHSETELHIPDSPMTTVRKCHSPCLLVDRKCSSPSIVRKFGAMLQENEGKVLVDGVVSSCSVPSNPKCNVGCCHSRWSCDASRFTNSKLSTHGSVQKSFSEVSVLTAAKNSQQQIPPTVKDLPVDVLLSSLEIPAASLKTPSPRRNIMLEQKTAEFNRTLFQAEMGRGVREQDSSAVTDARSVGRQPLAAASCAPEEAFSPRDRVQPRGADVTSSAVGLHSQASSSLPTMEATVPEVQPRGMRCGPEGQEVRTILSPEQPHTGLLDAAFQRPAHHSEVKHRVQTAASPSRKPQPRATSEATTVPDSPAHAEPGQRLDGCSSRKNENPTGAKPQSSRAGGSLESKQRAWTQSGHQAQPRPDSFRPGPRMMNEHPWKPLTLAAYPRPEGSRSNYGAVERILKNYESAARALQNQSEEDQVSSSPKISVKQEESITELDMLDMDPLPLPPTLRHTQTLSSHSVLSVKEMHQTVQGPDGYSWNT